MMVCTRCQGTGFRNYECLPDIVSELPIEEILRWVKQHPDSDVSVCDCCGDRNNDGWYGEPGYHYGPEDPPGPRGPYVYNGGLCECN